MNIKRRKLGPNLVFKGSQLPIDGWIKLKKHHDYCFYSTLSLYFAENDLNTKEVPERQWNRAVQLLEDMSTEGTGFFYFTVERKVK